MPIYHTNVIMAMGESEAIFCPDVCSKTDSEKVLRALEAASKEVVLISFEQVLQFAGNALEVLDAEGRARWVMSAQAYASLNEQQKARLEKRGPILSAPIPTIETIGGGSARCMIAEIFLQPK